MKYPRSGLRIRCKKGVHPEVRTVCLNFGRWLRKNMDFPIRVVVYLKSDYQIENRKTKEYVAATFFAPYDKDVEPYIRIATGDYDERIQDRGKVDALYAMLDTFAHEIIHYQQWINDEKTDEDEAEE
ncbi:hypothetical protein [Bacillus sp. mrc49]|uniref:hypothetical protein n=1 Tax=Bacillus sp. mrc49 TaxID=2054913 RepID=UPI000C27BCF3|nr:hypothetical protein [Bacillus sp. mrc49]PJN91482.1 hypothetical protein CVN76_04735 [Bacillus sp. mrc49]